MSTSAKLAKVSREIVHPQAQRFGCWTHSLLPTSPCYEHDNINPLWRVQTRFVLRQAALNSRTGRSYLHYVYTLQVATRAAMHLRDSLCLFKTFWNVSTADRGYECQQWLHAKHSEHCYQQQVPTHGTTNVYCSSCLLQHGNQAARRCSLMQHQLTTLSCHFCG